MRNTPTWEAVSSSASQAIGPVLLNPKVHYLIHNSLQLFPILKQLNSVHVIPACFFKTHFTIIRQHTPRSQKRYLPFRLHLQTIAVLPPPHVCHIPRPSQHHLLPSYSWWAVYSVEHAILLLVMQYPVASCYLDCSARVRGERETSSVCRAASQCQATTVGTNYCHIRPGWRSKDDADVCTRPYEGVWEECT